MKNLEGSHMNVLDTSWKSRLFFSLSSDQISDIQPIYHWKNNKFIILIKTAVTTQNYEPDLYTVRKSMGYEI